MINNKLHIAFILISLFVFSGCKKYSKDVTTVKIKAHLPHDGTPIPGIKWKIIETKLEGYFEPAKATGWEIEGETNGLGIADIKFNCKRNSDYQYTIYFDFDDLNLPTGTYVKTGGPTFANLDRNAHTNYEIRMLPKMDIQWNFKNLNCTGTTDTFKYRSINYDEHNNNALSDFMWHEGPELNGCVDVTGPLIERLAGHYAFEWEATRNGITETGIDTFYVAPGVNNVINMHW